MIVPCEVAVKSVIPAIKALMAKQLIDKHGMKQDQAAELLGISQSAVSKYTTKARGYVIKIDEMDEVLPLIDGMVTLLLNGNYQRKELLASFCQTCMAVRKTGLMCQFCHKADPDIDIEDCGLCMNLDALAGEE